jgi:hypothetical protein
MSDTTRPEDALADSTGGRDPVPLSVMMASGVRFEWHEATAVVQEICALLGGAGTPASMVLPDQEHVLIHPDGTLSFSSRGLGTAKSGGAQVTALARLLLSLVSETQIPVKLRLIVLSAISDTAPSTTAADFSSALAYYERPGRAAVIRSLYIRWHVGSREPVPAGFRIQEPATTKSHEPPVPPKPRRHRLVMALVAFVVLLAGGTAAWWFSGRPVIRPVVRVSQAATDLGSRAWTATRALAASGAAAVQSLVGGTPEPPPAVSEADAAQMGAKPSVAKPAGTTRGPKPAGSVDLTAQPSPDATVPPLPQIDVLPFKAYDLSASLLSQPPAREGVPPSAPDLRSGSASAAGTATGRGDTAAPLYSIADRDVEPPVPVKPKIATVLPADEREENLTVVDLIISDDGEVESVKLVRPVRGVRGAMMLSAVKAWRFQPALKDAQPVRYLKRIWISLSPIGTPDR